MKRGLILVTGSGGFNGRVLLKMLKSSGYNVRATDLEKGERTAEKAFYDSIGVEFIPSDLTDPGSLKKALKDVQYIMHTASLFDYTAGLEDNNTINVEGGRNLLEAAIEAGTKKIILWGTLGVYGEQEITPVTEENPTNPGNNYEISKLEQENLFLEYAADKKIKVAVMRPAPVYGRGNTYGFINLVKIMTIGPFVPIPEKMDVRLPSVNVIDVARAAIHLMEAADSKTSGQVFNVIDDSNIPLPEFLYYIAGLLGKPTLPLAFPINKDRLVRLGHFGAGISSRVGEMKNRRPLLEDATMDYMKYNYIFDNKKIKDTGFEFEYPDCRVGLIEMFDWIKEENMAPLRVG
ncbi:MAG TPA: NAD-dependent epimerase/dehydratase family protein [bacterium]|nr:NAD-dependent epimerase/dehydratase family protein [bacterium]